jgi:UDP-N-acetylmuramoylalanine--D-glutamate ligase
MRALLVGFGVTNRAVAGALLRRGHDVVAVDDRATADLRAAGEELGVDVRAAADVELDDLVAGVETVLPTPGLPDGHPAFALARRHGIPISSEFDLAREWDDRPLVAVTGTDGKTTVTLLTTAMLEASAVHALAVGNTETPLVAAIDDPTVDVFVVEASSFRLAHSRRFEPDVATWLNFAPDHLDAHADLHSYEAAKARIWRDQPRTAVAVGNADDPVVDHHLSAAPARHERFSISRGDVEHRLDGTTLVTPAGPLADVGELWRAFPHDIANGLAAAATALAAGASLDGCRKALVAFDGLPHRVALVGDHGGVRWYDDSKATTPHAAAAAVRAFESVVLIAGGRNKGLDLTPLADEASRVRAVVAIGEAADEVARAFEGRRPVDVASSMRDAVRAAADRARPGDVVLLSPGCASFDWYTSYAARGDDFVREVARLAGTSS